MQTVLHKLANNRFASECDFGKLATTWVQLTRYSDAVQAAHKANCPRTWKEVFEACMAAKAIHLSDTCGLHLLTAIGSAT